MALMIWCGDASAAAAPAYNGRMNAAVGGVITQKVSRWGFAANDPRYTATMTGVSSGLTTLVVGGLAVAVGSATWPAVLVGAGVTALISGAIALGQDSVYKWFFNSDGTITTSGAGGTSPTALVGGSAAFNTSCGGSVGSLWAPSISQAATACAQLIQATFPASRAVTVSVLSCGTSSCQLHRTACADFSCTATDFTINATAGTAPAAANCAGGFYLGSSCGVIPAVGGQPVTGGTLANAVANIPDTEAAKPVSNELLAAAVNSTWKLMGTSEPNAVPWSASDPVTAADVAQWKAANPSAVPTVGDLLAPVGSPSGISVPIAAPGASPSTGPAPTPAPSGSTKVDLGTDPNVGAPGLEATPTASSILAPIFNLMPDLRSFSVPVHSSACPTGSFTVYSKVYVIDSHCALIEANRSLIEAAMLLVWTIAAVFIVLRA